MNSPTLLLGFLLFFGPTVWGQTPSKKILGHEELVSWNRIQSPTISPDGLWVAYTLQPEEGDTELRVWNAQTQRTLRFPRGKDPAVSADSRFLAFRITPPFDSLQAMRRRKVKNDDLPKDTLAILRLATGEVEKVADLMRFRMPDKWSGWLVYLLEPQKPPKDTTARTDTTQTAAPDSTQTQTRPEKPRRAKKTKTKKENRKNGSKLVFHRLEDGYERIVPFVKDFALAEEGARVLLRSTGKDSTFLGGVYLFDAEGDTLLPLFRAEGEFEDLTLDKTGSQAAFHLNLDTTEARVAPFALAYWQQGQDSARILADTAAAFLPAGWRVSENGRLEFSEDGARLFFGVAPEPLLQDTSLLPEEVVNVEVWSWTDPVLYTQQESRLNRERRRTYPVVWHRASGRFVQLGDEEAPELQLGDEGKARYALADNALPYWKEVSWEGFPQRRDLYLVDVETGERTLIARGISGNARLSPAANWVFWYSPPDSSWMGYAVQGRRLVQLTRNEPAPFYDELNDRPMHPNSYGIAGWLEGETHLLIYDRYDIWKIDPSGEEPPQNLTNGRSKRLRYRYLRLDPEQRHIPRNGRLLLHVFDEGSKAGGYAQLDLGSGTLRTLTMGPFAYSTRPIKARNADRLIFTRENFQTFPDLRYADLNLAASVQVSQANPQQKDYRWGSIELVEWTSLDGERLQGLLVKPEGFDPSKQYPMIVNFYERSSDRLHRHPTPSPGRSTINYAFYASRGYLIFNPDVPYKVGYPGESAVNAVLSGVTHLIDQGFVDPQRIGVQGHSWGGYQVAYLLTKTNLFRCAEAGAPVVNMFSAYGGIRWGSGLSRMFQYERTQSRIGGTIWEYPLRYLENSPLFFLDKVTTPVLILHNDEDGAVPWYQGIEYFVALRRLGKPAWLLNYNDEPHWPLKLQNRKDFNIRMQQFFDHYLQDAPMPEWMKRGVPALEKGIRQGLQTDETMLPSEGN